MKRRNFVSRTIAFSGAAFTLGLGLVGCGSSNNGPYNGGPNVLGNWVIPSGEQRQVSPDPRVQNIAFVVIEPQRITLINRCHLPGTPEPFDSVASSPSILQGNLLRVLQTNSGRELHGRPDCRAVLVEGEHRLSINAPNELTITNLRLGKSYALFRGAPDLLALMRLRATPAQDMNPGMNGNPGNPSMAGREPWDPSGMGGNMGGNMGGPRRGRGNNPQGIEFPVGINGGGMGGGNRGQGMEFPGAGNPSGMPPLNPGAGVNPTNPGAGSGAGPINVQNPFTVPE